VRIHASKDKVYYMKDKVINIRISEEQYKQLCFKAQAVSKSNSEYIREAISTSEVKQDSSKIKSELIASLNHIGNNINQIAHSLNIAKKSDKLSGIDYKDLINHLTIIERYMKDISENN